MAKAAGKAKGGGTRWRRIGWGGAAALIALPALATMLSPEVRWSGGDFLVAVLAIGSAGICLETLVRASSIPAYRAGAALALLLALLLGWLSLAVGIVGNEANDANLMFAGVVAFALLGALGAGLRPAGMARAMAGTALAQAGAGAIALAGGLGAGSARWPADVAGLSLAFTAAWLAAAALFRSAARTEAVGAEGDAA